MRNKNIYFLIFLAVFIFFPKGSVFATPGTPVINVECLPGSTTAKVTLTWSPGVPAPSYFYIERRIAGINPFVIIATTTGTIYENFPINSGISYNYRIGGGVFFGTSSPATSTPVYCAPFINNIYSPPCQTDGPRINFSWVAATGNLSKYQIFRKKEGESSFSQLPGDIPSTTLSFSDGPNIEGTKNYYYIVKAIWQNNASSTSDSSLPKEAPTCPVDLSVSANCLALSPGGPQNNLSWNNLLGVQQYDIYRKAIGEPVESRIATTTQNSYSDKLVETLPNGYYLVGDNSYYVKAVWPRGDMKDSLTKQQSTIDCSPFLRVEDNCEEKSMRLFWTRAKGIIGNIHYTIYVNGFWLLQQTENTYIDAASCSGGVCSVSYRVEVVENLKTSDNVPKDMNCTDPPAPQPPPILDIPTAECKGSPLKSVIRNSWSSSANVSFYKLLRDGEIISPGPGAETYYDDYVGGGVNYTYSVRAVNTGGETPSSNQVNKDAVSCFSPSPPPVVSLYASCSASGLPFIDISWEGSSNVREYVIYKGTTSANLAVLTTLGSGALVLPGGDINVATSTTYYYKVRAEGPIGVNPSDSLIVSTTSKSCLPTVPSLYLLNSCVGQDPVIDLGWSTNQENTSAYQIFRDFVFIHPISFPYITTWQDDTVSPKQLYQYRVDAIGPLGQRSQSNSTTTTSWYCMPPDTFSLQNPNVYCKNSYIWASTSWTNSQYAISYDLNRYLYSGNTIIGTTTLNVGATTTFIDKGFGNALKFNGGTDRIEFEPSDSLNNFTKFSIEFWIKPEFKGISAVLGTTDPWNNVLGGFNFYLRNELDKDFAFNLGGAQWRLGNYTANNWYHIIGTYDERYMRLYVNGQYLGYLSKASSTFPYPIQNTAPLTIGTIPGLSSNFIGIIDEVRIYANMVTTSLALAHYNGDYSGDANGCGSSGTQNCDLRGLWYFDEGVGTIVTDSSNHNNNGTIIGATWVQSGPQTETKYGWQAIAYSNGSIPTLSNTTTAITTPSCPPSKPGLFLSSTCSPGPGIKLEWSFSINANQYDIWRSTGTAPAVQIKSIPAISPLWWIDSGLQTGTNYTYFIRAIGNGGSVDSASSSQIAPICDVPEPPENVLATPSCIDSLPRIRLSWDASPNADYYEIFRNGDSYASTGATSMFDDYPKVKVGKYYSYRVTARNTGGSSLPSDEATTSLGYCLASKPSLSVSTYCSSTKPINEINFLDSTFFNSKEYAIYRASPSTSITTILATDTAALKFSTNPITDIITCGQDSSLNIADKLTIEAWIKLESISPSKGFVSKGNGLSTTNYQFGTGFSGTLLRFRYGSTSEAYKESIPHGFAINNWYHVAVTVDTVSNVLKFYASGTLLSTTTFTDPLPTNEDFLIIGDGIDTLFKGNIDEVRIYNRILTAGEILQHYQRNYSAKETNLRGLWHFNEGRGQIARDSSGYANDCDMTPTDYRGADWEDLSLSPTAPTYSVLDTRFSNEYKAFKYDSQSLQSSTTYSYWIETTGYSGPSTSSILKSITTLNCEFTPLAPTNLSLNASCAQYKDPFNALSWNGSVGALSYNIYRSTTSGPVSTFYTYNSPFSDNGSFALDFAGTATSNVIITDPSFLGGVTDGLKAISVEFWIYYDSGASTDRGVLLDDGLAFHTFQVSAFSLSGPGGQSGYLGYNKTLTTGAWHHFMGTWDRDQLGNNMKLYVDGVLESEQPYNPVPPNNYLYYGDAHLRINDGWHEYTSIDGKVDELRIYSRALSTEEVFEHFKGVYKNESGLKGAWHFDEATGTQILDSSGNNNHGSIVGPGVVWLEATSGVAFFTSTIHRPPIEEQKSYDYQVTARGAGTESPPVSGSITSSLCQPSIKNFSITSDCLFNPTSGQLEPRFHLDWDSEDDSFSIFKRRTGDPNPAVNIATITDTDYYDIDLLNIEGTEYEYYISAINNFYGETAYSEIETSTTPLCSNTIQTPDITEVFPYCPSSGPGAKPRIRVKWDPLPLNPLAVLYEVWQKNEDCLSSSEVFEIAGTTTNRSFLDSSINNSESYCYKVKAFDVLNNSSTFSLSEGAITGNCEILSPAPAPSIALDFLSGPWRVGNLYLQIRWNDVSGDTGYKVFRKLRGEIWGDRTADEQKIADLVNLGAESDPIYYLETYPFFLDATNYDYSVSAWNINGPVYSNNLSVDLPIALPGPFTITGQDLANITISLFDEPATTVASGRDFYTFYRGSESIKDLPYDSGWATFTAGCVNTTSLSCIDYLPIRSLNWYIVRAQAQNWSSIFEPNQYTPSDSINLFVFAPKWREIKPW
ncbi:MAG: hypothetical protein NTU58_00900 [Candidatus Nealsonbacteria bacterium]|nr:hypothetical protein [Candidatus Nealsonbacteria bacterium]